nr:NADH-quinone oxidoreductase subunit J [Amycolatopsis sp. SID8362]
MFWVLAPIAVLAAIGMLAVAKAVHSALLLAVVMLCLAVAFVALGAEFLGVVQLVVYAGAIMMLFLFVLMTAGVDASESRVEKLRGQRVAAVLVGLAFGTVLAVAIGRTALPGASAASGGLSDLATLIFGRYVWAFEATSALLITAALSTMVLAHRRAPRKSQRELSRERVRGLLDGGRISPLPTPGVYAGRNAADVPALLPDGTRSAASVPGGER